MIQIFCALLPAFLLPIFSGMANEPLLQLDLPGVRKLKSGKVREIFDLGDRLLFVATDRISPLTASCPTAFRARARC